MDLSKVVKETTDKMIKDGTVEAMISEKLEKTIADGIDNALRSYSDFGKALSDKINESIQCAGRNIELPEYNQFIIKVVKEKFSQVLEENAVSHLSELIENAVSPVKKEAKVSELLEKITEIWTQEAREAGNEYIDIDVESNSDDTALYVLIKHPQYEFYHTKVTFYNFRRDGANTWHIGYLAENDKPITGKLTNRTTNMTNGVTDLLYQYYAMGTEFDMDEELESIYIADY